VAQKDIDLTTLNTWKSEQSGAIYPSQWNLKIPKLKLKLAIKAAVPDQEMRTPETTGVTYWEGSVFVEGFQNGQSVSGKGYAELKGYAEPLDVPM
jgi:predicted secreted hydrolase